MVTEQTLVSALPLITEESVRAALDALLYCSGARPVSALQQLTLVNQVLADPDMPFSPCSREFALNLVLTSVISNEMAQCRSLFGRAPLEQEHSLEAVQAAIAADSQTANPELMSWSWLYYRYVRVDLNLTPAVFSAIAHVDERTLRRYQQHGIRRFTQRLIEQEWAARRQVRKGQFGAEPMPVSPAYPFDRRVTSRQADGFLPA